MTLRRGETLLLTARHPGRLPAVLLHGARWCRRPRPPRSTSSCPGSWRWPSCRPPWSRSASPPASSAATACSSGSAPPRSGAHGSSAPRSSPIVAVELLQAAVLLPVGLGLGWNPGGRRGFVAVRRRHRRHPPRLDRLRRASACFMAGVLRGRGQPGRGQRPLPGPAAARRHDRPDRASSRRPGLLRQALAGRGPVRRPARHARARALPVPGRVLGRARRSGRWRRRLPPRSPSAGNEGPLRPPVNEAGRTSLRAGRTIRRRCVCRPPR